MPWVIGGAVLGGALLSSNSASNAADQQAAGTDKALASQNQQFNTSREDLAPYRSAGTAALTRLQALLGIGPSADTNPHSPLSEGQVSNLYQHYFGRAPSQSETAWQLANTPTAADFENNIGGNSEYQARVQSGQAPTARMYDPNAPVQASGPTDSPLLRSFSSSDLNADPVYNSGLQFGLDEGTKALERHAAATGSYDSGAGAKAIARFANDYGSTKAADSRARFVEDQNNTFGKLSGISGMGSGATTVGVNAGSANASNLASLYTGQGNANAAASIAGGNAFSGGANSIANYVSQQQLLQQLQGGGARTLKPDASMTGAGDIGATSV